jgi:hypothetical protein
MVFSIQFALHLGRDTEMLPIYDPSRGGVPMADEWAVAAARQFKQDEGAFDAKNDRARQERDIMVSQAPLLWQQLQQVLQTQAKAFNEQVGQEVVTISVHAADGMEMIARSDRGQRNASLTFNPANHSVIWDARSRNGSNSKSGVLQMKVTQENSVAFLGSGGGYEEAAEMAGRTILNALLSWK